MSPARIKGQANIASYNTPLFLGFATSHNLATLRFVYLMSAKRIVIGTGVEKICIPGASEVFRYVAHSVARENVTRPEHIFL
jgi:hypothetical protein